jgi:hypothetical protein
LTFDRDSESRHKKIWLEQKSADASRFRRRPRKARRASTPPRARGRSSLRVRSFGSVPFEVRTRRERHHVSARRISFPTRRETSAFPADAPVPPNRSRRPQALQQPCPSWRPSRCRAPRSSPPWLPSAGAAPCAARARSRPGTSTRVDARARDRRGSRPVQAISLEDYPHLRFPSVGRRRPIGSIGGGGVRGRAGTSPRAQRTRPGPSNRRDAAPNPARDRAAPRTPTPSGRGVGSEALRATASASERRRGRLSDFFSRVSTTRRIERRRAHDPHAVAVSERRRRPSFFPTTVVTPRES